MIRKRNYGDEWNKRRPPNRYTTKALRAMLVDDLVRYRPPGGPMAAGAQWLVLACGLIAQAERKTVDETWLQIIDEASSKLGHECIPALA